MPLPNRDTGNPRKDLGQPTASRIEPGVATIEDVLLKLGEPDAVSPDERSLAYRSQKTVAMWTAAGGYSAGGGSIDEVRFLVIRFDEHGIVSGCQATNLMPGLFSPPKRGTPQAVIGTTVSSIGNEPVRISGVGNWYPDFEITAWKFVSPKGSGSILRPQ